MRRFVLLLLPLLFLSCAAERKDPHLEPQQDQPYGVFAFQKEVTLPGVPTVIFDAITGDISGWWDHSFSENPYKFYIEPRPGGGFYEIFDESGDGVLHATVIAAQRGKLLRFDGPLGLAGRAVQVVTTYTFEPAGEDSTKLQVNVHSSGEIDQKTADVVERVWEHFIFERFEPYIKEGRHLE